jgi:hypothetical protein
MNYSAPNTVKNIGSFVSAPVNAVANVANHTATSLKNTAMNMKNATASIANNVWNSNMVQDIAEPIQNSYAMALENNPESIFSMPLIILLGVLIVFFILFMIFREQITWGAEIAWMRIRGWFGGGKSDVPLMPASAIPPEEAKDHPVDTSMVQKMLPGKKDVFNIATNRYTYQDAEPLCKAFGAELATYDQVKEAWSKGADWCNYGWVKGQSAVYPTQQATYDKLQAGPEGERMACGTPGINGGYFDNPELRFGVTCYGSRPSENETDVRRKMASDGSKTADGIAYNRKVQDYKAHLSDIPVNPFSESSWSG